MYTLLIKSWETHRWQAYVDYLNNQVYVGFERYLLENYPEILTIHEERVDMDTIKYFQLTITFQSEQHYQWFLLKQ